VVIAGFLNHQQSHPFSFNSMKKVIQQEVPSIGTPELTGTETEAWQA